MKKILLVIISTIMLSGCSPKELTYRDHLDKAEQALSNIRLLTGEKETAFIPIAIAAGEDDQAITDSANEAVDEIGNAQDKVNDMSDDSAREAAQSEVDTTKNDAKNTFTEAAEASENPETQNGLEELGNDLENIQPEPRQEPNAAQNDPNNVPDEESMSADPNNDDGETNTDANTDEENADSSESEAQQREGDEDGEDDEDDEGSIDRADPNIPNGDQADYEAFQKATNVNFQPIYEGTNESPLDKAAENTMNQAEADLINRVKIEEAAHLDMPALDQAAIERAMQELTQ